ncbi:MAG: hypothetical protein ACI9TK_000607 [Flavobacteriaceae bacterium]|jgi:hypothetical protein|tara:strand:+ start:4426 stop:4929 length:504 start_codon:yes stop_codon:yes gene_type:complete
MNLEVLKKIASFVFLVFVQIIIFNQMNIFGYVNPMVYILFLVMYPFNENKTLYIFLGFMLGFFLDFLSRSGGSHTIASLSISFLRPIIIRYSYGLTSELPQSFQTDPRKTSRFMFLLAFVGIHHLIYFSIIYFSLDAFLLIIKNSLLTSIFSLILILLISSLYRVKK